MLRFLTTCVAASVLAQTPASRADDAYEALRNGRLDEAVAAFSDAVQSDPRNAHLRKDFAYTLLKTGEREQARDQFGAARGLAPSDESTALEYAFLCYETGKPIEARRIFLTLRGSADTHAGTTAEAAFESIDKPLREGIAQWQQALQKAPGQWSAHEELARLAEQRDEIELAAEHYEQAWKMRPDRPELLPDMARAWQAQQQPQKARAALVTAWRSGSPRVMETAREMLGGEIPGEQERGLITAQPRAATGYAANLGAKEMGKLSLQKSYLNDAFRYFALAHQQDPSDAEVLYKLGVTSNLMHRDNEALQWFGEARHSGDPTISAMAERAYRNLRPASSRLLTSFWTAPFYSSRWNTSFFYGQLRVGPAPFKLGKIALTPYLSTRFSGDTQGSTATAAQPAVALYLSETSVILGGGLAAQLLPTVVVWGEAGESFSYIGHRPDSAFAKPDYLAGATWFKGWGRLLGASERGLFTETELDGVYASRFQDDVFLYSLTRAGLTFARSSRGFQLQSLLNLNLSLNSNRYYWSNLVEAGPGVKLHIPGSPNGLMVRVDFLRGVYLDNSHNPRGPNYWDLRAGIWYAFTR